MLGELRLWSSVLGALFRGELFRGALFRVALLGELCLGEFCLGELCLGELLSVDSDGYWEECSGDGHHPVGFH